MPTRIPIDRAAARESIAYWIQTPHVEISRRFNSIVDHPLGMIVAAQLLRALALPENSMMPPSNTARTPALSEGALIHTRESFGRALRVARERSGVALGDIARVTKVGTTYYEALERGDLRRWPKGIFRRTFFRGYVERIGVAVAETTGEFIRLFPDEDGVAGAAPQPVVQETTLRLGLDASWHGPKTPIISRLMMAMTDSFVVVMLASIGWIAGLQIATAAAVTSFVYFTLGVLLFGESPAAWMKRRGGAVSRAAARLTELPQNRDRLQPSSEGRYELSIAVVSRWLSRRGDVRCIGAAGISRNGDLSA